MTGSPAAELPPAVRIRVVALAEETLAALDEKDVPASLRAVRRFTPSKRARLGAAALGAALDTEPAFRWAVAERVRAGLPAVADAVDTGAGAAAVDPADLAAVAYVLNAPDWAARVTAVVSSADTGGDAGDGRDVDAAGQDAAAMAEAQRELRRLRREVAAARTEADDLRRRLQRAEEAGRRSEQAREDALRRSRESSDAEGATERRLSAEIRRTRQQLHDAEQAAAAARRNARGERDAATARLRVLLETIANASAGLRRELDLPAAPVHPADLLASGEPADAATSVGLLATLRRGRRADDPALVDDLLAVPGLHLIIDGYNVTKLGYPALTLESQRSRLTNALAGLAARAAGAELTCVFDGTAALSRPVAGAVPRGLRVLFSAPDELADQLIERLVDAEPVGRPVVVITNDREVITSVTRAGADALASGALIGRLERL